jgi:AcrR family transcriptional regulator
MKGIEFSDEKEIAIIEQVSQVYLKKGVKSITMDDMAKELRISKKTLYKYVKNRAELVKKSVYFHVLKEQKLVEEIQAKELNPIQETREIASYVIDTLSKINPVVHYDLEKYFPDSWQLLNKYFSGFVYNSILINLENGQKSGVYRENFSPEIIAKLFISKIDSTFDAEMFPQERFTFVQVYIDFIQHHLYGIVSEKGSKILNKINFTNI